MSSVSSHFLITSKHSVFGWLCLGVGLALVSHHQCFGQESVSDPPDPQSIASQQLHSQPTAPQVALPEELELIWEYQASEAIESSPATAGEQVFVADVFGKLYAIGLSNGNEHWTRNFDTGFVSSPAIHDDLLVIGDVEGNIYALEADSGKTRWQATTKGEINATASFHKDNVLLTSQDGKLYCYKTTDGTLRWTYETEDQIRCRPSIAGDRTFLGGCDGRLHIVDLNTGKAVDEPLPLGGPTGSTPFIHGNRAYLPVMSGTLFAFDWKANQELWKYEDEDRAQEYRNSAAANDEVVILSSARKLVDAISTKTGKRVWRHTLRRRADASPVISGDDVLIAGTDGRLTRLSVHDGSVRKWSYEVRGSFLSAPVILGTKLLIADDNGIVRCFSGKKTAGKP